MAKMKFNRKNYNNSVLEDVQQKSNVFFKARRYYCMGENFWKNKINLPSQKLIFVRYKELSEL